MRRGGQLRVRAPADLFDSFDEGEVLTVLQRGPESIRHRIDTS